MGHKYIVGVAEGIIKTQIIILLNVSLVKHSQFINWTIGILVG
jgi:hypothetical protein